MTWNCETMLTPTTCHMSCVTCHMSHVTCHMSCVMCHMSCKKKNYNNKNIYIELVGWGSVINGAYPVYFITVKASKKEQWSQVSFVTSGIKVEDFFLSFPGVMWDRSPVGGNLTPCLLGVKDLSSATLFWIRTISK